LKELFGENYLSVLEVTGSYSDKSKNFEGSVKLTKEKGDRLYISGGIYIFERVENDEDREWYRKQIYEFIQFMKETGTFEYVDLDISIMDERILTSNSEKLVEELKFNDKDMDAWRKRRRKVMAKINRDFEKMSQDEKLDKINSINKKEYLKRSVGGLLYTKIYSSKYIESQGFNDEKKKEYELINDIEFKWEVW
ncbi:hypothetical protein V6R56_15820, partial [Fusobacterium varium]